MTYQVNIHVSAHGEEVLIQQRSNQFQLDCPSNFQLASSLTALTYRSLKSWDFFIGKKKQAVGSLAFSCLVVYKSLDIYTDLPQM